MSRESASAALPFTSLMKIAMAARYDCKGSLCHANSVPDVTVNSLLHALQRHRGGPFGRRTS